MLPILVPNIGFKKFAEIKPNEGIQLVFFYLFMLATKSQRCHQHFIFASSTKLEKWLTNIRADTNSMQAIHKSRNNFEGVKKDHFFKETYTGMFKEPRTTRTNLRYNLVRRELKVGEIQ